MVNKVWPSAAEAVADIPDGAFIAMHCQVFEGTPSHLIRALIDSGVKDLTLMCTNFIPLPVVEAVFPTPASLLPQLKKVITAGVVGARTVGEERGGWLGDAVSSGRLETEVLPHGVYYGRLHAGAMGYGGYYEPVGVGTTIAAGKEIRIIDGKEYYLEKPLRPDFGIIKAHKADRLGNLTYYGGSRAANPNIAIASKLNIIEVDELVEVGEIDPEMVVTPGIYVDRIVVIPEGDVGSAKQKRELIRTLLENEVARQLLLRGSRK